MPKIDSLIRHTGTALAIGLGLADNSFGCDEQPASSESPSNHAQATALEESIVDESVQATRVELLKVRSLEIAKKMTEVVRELRMKTSHPDIDLKLDPYRTGLMGLKDSKITSIKGTSFLKQAATHPDWPAVIVEQLWKMGVRPGDTVALTWTGSLPGTNLSFAAAAEAMQLDVRAIASLCSSEYGANIPEMTWLHIEKTLHEKGLLSWRSLAASRGGAKDMANGKRTDSELIARIIRDLDVELIDSHSREEGIQFRLERFAKEVDGDFDSYAGMINIGGAGAAIAGGLGNLYPSGILMDKEDLLEDGPACVTRYFVDRGIRALNLRWLFAIHISEDYNVMRDQIDKKQKQKLENAQAELGEYKINPIIIHRESKFSFSVKREKVL